MKPQPHERAQPEVNLARAGWALGTAPPDIALGPQTRFVAKPLTNLECIFPDQSVSRDRAWRRTLADPGVSHVSDLIHKV